MKLRLNIFANYQYFNVVLKQFSNLTFFIIPPSSVRQKFISNFIIYEQWPLSENWEECFVSDNPSNKKATKSHNSPLLWWSKNPPITHPFCKLQKLFIILQGSKAILQIVFFIWLFEKSHSAKVIFYPALNLSHPAKVICHFAMEQNHPAKVFNHPAIWKKSSCKSFCQPAKELSHPAMVLCHPENQVCQPHNIHQS